MVERVHLYRAPTTVADADAVAHWLRERVDAAVTVRDRLLDRVRDGSLARALARTRVLSPSERATGSEMLGVVRYEERALDDPARGGGVLYDGRGVQRACNARLPADECALSTLHVGLLDRALATWGDHDGRWHKRILVGGQPALVSVPGLYEAPAKPESYYRAKRGHALATGGAPPREVLEAAADGEFLVGDDPRTTEAVKGYVLQAVHLVETGEGFCAEPACRLSNAHRQPALVRAQLREPAFCDDHAPRYA